MICNSTKQVLKQVTENINQWAKEYRFNPASGDFEHQASAVDYPNLNDFYAVNPTSESGAKTHLLGPESSYKDSTSPSLFKKIFG